MSCYLRVTDYYFYRGVAQSGSAHPPEAEGQQFEFNLVQSRYYVYVLRSKKNGRFYTGHTDNLKRRIFEHNKGKSKSTSNRGPFELVYFETCDTRSQAVNREKFLKSGKGREFLKKQLE